MHNEIEHLENLLRYNEERLDKLLREADKTGLTQNLVASIDLVRADIQRIKSELSHKTGRSYSPQEYTYVSEKTEKKTTDRGVASKYNAQQRYFGMSKLKRAMATLTGQKRKMLKLMDRVTDKNNLDLDLETRNEDIDKLDKMFR